MILKAHYKKNVRSAVTIGIVEDMSNYNGWTNIYFQPVTNVKAGDILDMSATVQASLLGRNFPAFFAGCIAVSRFSGDYGAIASKPHGIDLSPQTGVPYVALTHIGLWQADQDYATVWPIVWAYSTSLGHQGQLVDIYDNGQLVVRHYSEAEAQNPLPPSNPPTEIQVPPEGMTIHFTQAAA